MPTAPPLGRELELKQLPPCPLAAPYDDPPSFHPVVDGAPDNGI